MSKKKPYEKPELKPLKMMEVGAALCCRASTATCSNPLRNTKGKLQRTLTGS